MHHFDERDGLKIALNIKAFLLENYRGHFGNLRVIALTSTLLFFMDWSAASMNSSKLAVTMLLI
jgi:hypothetical protein